MASTHCLQFLRPYVSRPLLCRQSPYLRFYHLARQYHAIQHQPLVRQQRRAFSSETPEDKARISEHDATISNDEAQAPDSHPIALEDSSARPGDSAKSDENEARVWEDWDDKPIPSFQAIVKALDPAEDLDTAKKAALSEAPAELLKEALVANPFEDERSLQVEKRIRELKAANALQYPRLVHDIRPFSIRMIHRQYEQLTPESPQTDVVLVYGRVVSIRRSGGKLAFIDLQQNAKRLQIIVNLLKVQSRKPDQDQAAFKSIFKLLKRGDLVGIKGRMIRQPRGMLTLEANELPRILSPSLVPLPEKLVDEDTRIQNRHLDLLVNQDSIDNLRLKAHVIHYIRLALQKMSFIEVQTPILAANAGGAIARPFTTVSKATRSKELALRIAPELWLKRLVVGGMDRVFEIGPSFRNEGIDATHNPEFTTCEFYAAYWNLDELIVQTAKLMKGLVAAYNKWQETELTALPRMDLDLEAQFAEVEFVPELQYKLKSKLPDLDSPTALEDLMALLDRRQHVVNPYEMTHDQPSLPKLLDRLAGALIEPLSAGGTPVFIKHHPACMSPLAKSFRCRRTGQRVSARAELFVGGREIANMYEEENDPFEQRRKFVEQATRRRSGAEREEDGDGGEEQVVDDGYVAALESGLPPTGGFGCGVERLVMMLSGAKKIGDVLSFGNLRNVVAVSSNKRAGGGDKDDTIS